MKRGGGVASDDDIAPDVLADIGQGDEDAARQAVERLKTAGRIVAVAGGWSTPDWHDVQRETSSTERVRRHREKMKRVETDVTVTSCFMERDETVKRPTVHNSTVQNDDDTRVRETPEPVMAIAAPPPSTAAAPEPATDDVQRKFEGHPAHEALLPIARAAVSILGACPEVYTLESWLQSGYSLPRIEYGLRQAKQSAAGQWMPMGKIIISAGRWMQRAAPEEYQKRPQQAAGGAIQVQSISIPHEPERRPLTAEETAEMLKELGV